MKPHIKTICLIVLLFFINISLFSDLTPISYDYKIDNINITVACVEDTGFIKKTSPTTYSGYLVDYLNKLGEFHNLHFHYIFTKTEKEARDLVSQGIADISCLQYKTPELENYFDFSQIHFSVLETNLYSLADNDNYYFDDYNSFDKMVIGVRKDLNTIDEIAEYAKKGNFNYSLRYYPTEIELQQALIDKKVNSIATDYKVYTESKLKQIGTIAYKKTYIISKKDNPLLDEINYAINWVHVNNSNYFNYLQENYFQDTSSYIEFTREEIKYINNLDTLTVGFLPDAYILSHYNEKTNEFEGIIADYMKELEKVSKLKFKFVVIPHGLKIQEALEQGLCDISPYLSRNEATLNDKSITASINYINMKELIAIRKDKPFQVDEVKTISCPTNYQGLLNYITNEYPEWNVIKTKANNILDPLLAGVVDVAIGNEYELRYLMQKPKYSELFLTENYLVDLILAIGIRSSNDPLLLSIINKSINNVSGKTVEYLKLKGLLTNYQYTFFDSYLTNSIFFNLLILLLISIILGLLLFAFYQKKTNEKFKKNEIALNLSNKKYEKANRAKTDFLAAMSHDLRTPMNAIIGLTELSKENLENKDDLENYIEKIDISAKYLLGLINDILDISAIEDGKLLIAEDPFDLKELINEITSMYNVSSEQSKIEFSSNADTIYFESLIGDYYRLKQIITNLLSNAFKFTHSGGKVELNIKQRIENDNKVTLSIIVSDTGIGISQEIKDKIYNKFVQADSGTLRKFGGSGLGLSIVKNLVQLMDGKISLESTVGIGSLFKIDIPIRIDTNHIDLFKTFNKNSFSNIKILIIDHDKRTAFFTSKLISKIGAKSRFFCNVENAYEELTFALKDERPYNLIIIDPKFPNLDIIDFVEKVSFVLKESPHYVVLTGYDITYLKSEVKTDYIDYYLTKPIFLSSLLYILNDIQKDKSSSVKAHKALSFDQSIKLIGLKVLLCEDNDINQLVGKKILESYGCETVIAENGEIGFETFINSEDNTFDAILMDIRMPIMDGYEATKLIRNSNTKTGKSIPIFAMTANVMKEDIEASLKIGMNGHIAKPIENHKLYEILKTIWVEKQLIK